MGPRRPMSVKFRKKVASYHPGSALNSLKKFHDDRMNGLVCYKGHAHTHTQTYFDFYIYRWQSKLKNAYFLITQMATKKSPTNSFMYKVKNSQLLLF